MSNRERRLASNEATAREINDQIEDAVADGSTGQAGPIPIVCECGYEGCEEAILINADDYAELRTDPRHFAVLREHVIDDVEQVVADGSRYTIVKKREGDPAEIARDRARNQ